MNRNGVIESKLTWTRHSCWL